jgi:hypothetical protein
VNVAELYFKQKAKDSGGAGGLLVVTVDRASLPVDAQQGEEGERPGADVDTFVAIEFGGANQRTHAVYVPLGLLSPMCLL